MTEGETFDVVIVGAGISGIGMAAHLAQTCPGKSYAVLERRERLGGTWDLFRYPGIRSDSDMFTLGYAFAPWREQHAIAQGGAIRDYLHRVAADHGVAEHIRYGRHVKSADWDATAGLWRIAVEGPEGPESCAARFLFMGTGYYDYDEAHDAKIPGIASFKGEVIHPQFWPESFDPAGKRIVVIGSGATAVTIIPAMAKQAAHVTMLQRTPSWYMSMPALDRWANLLRRLLPETWAYRLIRARNRTLHALFFRRSRRKPEAVGRWLAGQTEKALGHAYRAEDFSPPYGPWQQRLCLVPDGDLFTAIREGRASVATGKIARVESGGVWLEDGLYIPADVIVTATGLKLATLGKVALSMDGEPIVFPDHFWYRDCMLSNVPNLAVLFGYLNASWTLRVDIVADRLCRMLRQMDAWGLNVATPALPDDHGLTVDQPFDLFSSGYLQRSKHLIPKSATTAPWRIHMHYDADRREMTEAPIDDGWMRFERVPAATTATKAATAPLADAPAEA